MKIKAQKIADQLIKEHEVLGVASANIANLAHNADVTLRHREAETKLFADPLHYKGYTFTYQSPRADLLAKLGILADRKCDDCCDTGWKFSDGQFIPCHCPAERG